MPATLITVDLSPASLEYETSKLLKEAFKDRGLTVRHNGNSTTCAPGGRPDIVAFNDDVHINVETTKLLRVAQTNQEATPVPTHLDDTAASNPSKKVLAVFLSPHNFERTINLFHHYNNSYAALDHRKIAFVDFSTFNIFLDWLLSSRGANFRVVDLCQTIRACAALGSDHEVLEYINRAHAHHSEI
jgi:hypothetical protein